MDFVRSLDVAVQFLTVFKIRVDPPPDMAEIGRSVWAFPLAGALVGAIMGVCHYFARGHIPMPLLGVLVVGIWIVLTGGLHLDGWADCCDALMVPASPERRLEIMKDSRIGTFGAAGLILMIGTKATALGAEGFPSWGVFLAPVVGRTAMVLGCAGVRTPAQGMAASFITGLDRGAVRAAGIIGLVLSALGGWPGIVGLAAAIGTTFVFRGFARSRLAAINGDVMGAMCELSEAVFVVAMSARW
ncbi:MAG: adenosylcobinamide-GDP ribazoletransferase [Thermodesulfobacteriota bacterium]